MSWIEYHTALRDHWKIKRLATIMEVDYLYALGAISCLWLWVAEYAPNGNITRFSDAEIRDAARCSLQKFTKTTLKACELINEQEHINDWHKHGLKLLESNRRRVREFREKKRYGNVTVMPTNRTLPTVPNQPIKALFSFEEVYLKYPVKVGKKAAETHFKTSVKTPQDWVNIQMALKNYLKSERVSKGFIQNASTWFNNWRDWIVPAEGRVKHELSPPEPVVPVNPAEHAKVAALIHATAAKMKRKDSPNG